MHDTGCLGLVHWDDPEGWNGHSSTLAWEIPWMEELVGCSPWGHEESDTAPPTLTPPPPQAYRPCAQRASVLFFVLNDMGRIDPMYQFSLDAYISLFILSIDKSHRSNKLEDRIDYLNEYHTYAVYRSGRLTAPRARRV